VRCPSILKRPSRKGQVWYGSYGAHVFSPDRVDPTEWSRSRRYKRPVGLINHSCRKWTPPRRVMRSFTTMTSNRSRSSRQPPTNGIDGAVSMEPVILCRCDSNHAPMHPGTDSRGLRSAISSIRQTSSEDSLCLSVSDRTCRARPGRP
jgi:hypothetical protein